MAKEAEGAAAAVAKGGEERAVHGNSLKSLKPTWSYKLYKNDGTFLKNGITSKAVPETRYTNRLCQIVYESDLHSNRASAYGVEAAANKILKGPLNLNNH